MSNLQLRILSGAVFGTVVLGATWFGGWPFRVLCLVIGAGVYVEWRKITGTASNALLVRAAELVLIAAFALLVAGFPPIPVFGLVFVAALLAIVAKFAGHSTGWLASGVLYAGFPAASLAFLRADHGEGFATVMILFAIVWGTDIFAYFVGRSLGGPKLAPTISPGKTWSGAVGGTAAAVAAGLAVAAWFGPAGNPVFPLVIVLVSAWSQMGDLFESWVKRRFGVKDSGTMIPGHGGMMDRVDGLAAAASALYVLSAAAELL
ncbi:MAG: phosphatidate cytidylyltransferase [Rhizobiaceae bacterium]